MLALLSTFSWQELRQHPWRNAAAIVAVMLGVALAFSVHLINASALDEFAQAARSVGGQSDLELRAVRGHFDETLYPKMARLPGVALASPVLEISSYVITPAGKRPVRIIGVDALQVLGITPDLMPIPQTAGRSTAGNERWTLFAPGQVFLNPAARRLTLPTETPAPADATQSSAAMQLQNGLAIESVTIAGTVRAGGPALAVMDIGAAQALFGKQGQLTRIDLRLQPGTDRAAFTRLLEETLDPSAHVAVAAPQDAQSQVSNLTRAYRVNLAVLALIALFTGAFLVFSVLSLSVAKRAQQFALLGVLGLGARARMALVLWESLILGLVGSVAGLALGTVLAALALQLLGGDLGGGFFSGAVPALQFNGWAALLYGGLGVLAALAGGWWPARFAQRLTPAQTLKGLGHLGTAQSGHWISLLCITLGLLLTAAPAVFGIALAAYVAIALLLLGGITGLPWLIGVLLGWLTPRLSRQTVPLLALERARRQSDTAAVAVSGVVASLSLAVALTVMVASFRESVTHWLDLMLPADLYVRSAGNLAATDTVFFNPEFVAAASRLPGVKKLQSQRMLPLQLQSDQAAVSLLARELGDPTRTLPLLQPPVAVPEGMVGVFVSEAVVDLFGARPGQVFPLLSQTFMPLAQSGKAKSVIFFVAAVWRDYARQNGAIVMDRSTFEDLTGDRRSNELSLWLHDAQSAADVQRALLTLAGPQAARGADPVTGTGGLLEFGTTAQIRAIVAAHF
jgi:putative ABC transport system permease protein